MIVNRGFVFFGISVYGALFSSAGPSFVTALQSDRIHAGFYWGLLIGGIAIVRYLKCLKAKKLDSIQVIFTSMLLVADHR